MKPHSERLVKMLLAALFVALTAVGAMITIPFGPVPFTMQNFFVFMSGAVLGPAWGAVSQLVYLLLGLFGLPVFSGFSGGLAAVFKPSFGFLLSFPLVSAVTGLMRAKRGLPRLLLAGACGMLAQYAVGAPYMALILGSVNGFDGPQILAALIGLAAFLPADAVKLAVAGIAGRRLIAIINTIFLKKKAI